MERLSNLLEIELEFKSKSLTSTSTLLTSVFYCTFFEAKESPSVTFDSSTCQLLEVVVIRAC